MLAYVWFGLFDNLGTFLGLLSAGIAIALQDLLISFAGWVFILWRHPFHTGDRIRVGDEGGEFRDIAREEWSPENRDGRLGGAVVACAVLRFEPRTNGIDIGNQEAEIGRAGRWIGRFGNAF